MSGDDKRDQGVTMPRAWIEAAKCPNCGGVGWTAHQVAAGEWEQEQCQWCYEQHEALHCQPVAVSHVVTTASPAGKYTAPVITNQVAPSSTPPLEELHKIETLLLQAWEKERGGALTPLGCAVNSIGRLIAVLSSTPPSAIAARDDDFLRKVCEELFGCFIEGPNLDGNYDCACCNEPIRIREWVWSAHDQDCVIPKVRAYLVSMGSGSVPPRPPSVTADGRSA